MGVNVGRVTHPVGVKLSVPLPSAEAAYVSTLRVVVARPQLVGMRVNRPPLALTPLIVRSIDVA